MANSSASPTIAPLVEASPWRRPPRRWWIIALAFLAYFAIDPVERLLGVG